VASLNMLLQYLPKVKTTPLSHDGRLASRDMRADLLNVELPVDVVLRYWYTLIFSLFVCILLPEHLRY